jgi:hypothetical protein
MENLEYSGQKKLRKSILACKYIIYSHCQNLVPRVLMVKWLERPTLIFNARGSNPGLVIGIFLQYFIISATLAPSGPLSGESTFHYHQSWQLTCLIQLCHEMPVCECECVNECDFRLKVVCGWGLFWPGMVGGGRGPPSLNHTCLSLEISASVKTDPGVHYWFIG